MPVILALISAIATGLFIFLRSEAGQNLLNQWIEEKGIERRAQKRAAAHAEIARVPLRSLDDPREVALVLLVKLATLRGTLTTEQRAAIANIAQVRLGIQDRLDAHMAQAEFISGNVPTVADAVSDGCALLRKRLSKSERLEFVEMLNVVAALHGGETDEQTSMISRIMAAFKYDSPL